MPLKETSDENWERIKEWVGGAKKTDTKHPVTQEMERMRSRNPEHMSDGGVSGDPYNDQATNIMGGVTPETIAQLSQSLARPTTGQNVGAAFAGLGDAIASVGGQNPGHLQATEDLIQRNRENAMKVPAEMAAVGKERFGISQGLQDQDPSSTLSKYAQQAYGPLAKKLGIDVTGASAKFIGDLAGKTVEQLKNEAQEHEARAVHEQTAAYQETNLDLQKKALENTIANQAKQREEEQQRIRSEAAKGLAGEGFIKNLEAMIPGTAGHTAHKVLTQQATGQKPAPEHPEANDALQWAEQHPNDPRSSEILKRLRK